MRNEMTLNTLVSAAFFLIHTMAAFSIYLLTTLSSNTNTIVVAGFLVGTAIVIGTSWLLYLRRKIGFFFAALIAFCVLFGLPSTAFEKRSIAFYEITFWIYHAFMLFLLIYCIQQLLQSATFPTGPNK